MHSEQPATLEPVASACQECGQIGRADRYHTYLHCLQEMHDTGVTLSPDEIASLLTYAWAVLDRETRVS